MLQPELAMAQLEKATSATQALKDWLWLIIPVIGLISAGIIGILYSFDVIRKETAYQWAVGMVFAGAIAMPPWQRSSCCNLSWPWLSSRRPPVPRKP
ncbi:hypothetical protein CTI14_56890 [Methylobacterium radiotolerans]|nr:hypothetical protein CTI14_56890 [Methylobacterium radiotolerans]